MVEGKSRHCLNVWFCVPPSTFLVPIVSTISDTLNVWKQFHTEHYVKLGGTLLIKKKSRSFGSFSLFHRLSAADHWLSPTSFLVMNILLAIFKSSYPFAYHFITHYVLSIHFTNVTVNFNCFHTFSTEMTNYRAYFTTFSW
jgi:hypothetical protein